MEIQLLIAIILSAVILLTCLLVICLYCRSKNRTPPERKKPPQTLQTTKKNDIPLEQPLLQDKLDSEKNMQQSQHQNVNVRNEPNDYKPPQPTDHYFDPIENEQSQYRTGNRPFDHQPGVHDNDWESAPSEGLSIRLISITSLPLARVLLSCQAKAMHRGNMVGGEVKWPTAVTETTTLIWNTTRYFGCLREDADCVRIALVTQDRSVYGKAEIPMRALILNTIVNTRVACLDGTEVVVSVMSCPQPDVIKSVFLMKLPVDDELQSGMSGQTRILAEELEKKIAAIIQHPMNEVELEFCNVERVVLGPFVLAAQTARICLQPLVSTYNRNVTISRYAKLNSDVVPANATFFDQFTQERTRHLYMDNPRIANHLLENIPIDTAELCTQNLLDCTDASTLKSLINQLVFAPDKIFMLLLSHEYCEMLLTNNLSDNIPDLRRKEILNSPPFSIMHFDMDFRLAKPIRNVSTLAAGVVSQAVLPSIVQNSPPNQEVVRVPAPMPLVPRRPSFHTQLAPPLPSDPSVFGTPADKTDVFEGPRSPPQHNLNSLVSHTPGVTSIRMMPFSQSSRPTELDNRESDLQRREIELGGREVALLLREKQANASRISPYELAPYR